MAGNKNSGGSIPFNLSDRELAEKIKAYKDDVEAKNYAPNWDHFCAFLGFSRSEVQELYDTGTACKNAYSKRADMLKKHETWIIGESFIRSGRNTSTPIYLSKQARLDGTRFTDQDTKGAVKVETVIRFGGDDPRAKRAGK
ncbi:MAG: hypothetical protein ACI3V4_08160 [Faecousia sp.]